MGTLTDEIVLEAIKAAGFPTRDEYLPAMRKGIQAALDRLSLQAPTEPKATNGWGDANHMAHDEPTTPSPVEAQTGCSCFLHFYGESRKCVKCGLPRIAQAQQAQVADREALAKAIFELPPIISKEAWANMTVVQKQWWYEQADALLSSGLIRPAPTREQIITWCRERFGAESAEAVAEDISSSLISPSPKASSAGDR